jgi:hypothetical protein
MGPNSFFKYSVLSTWQLLKFLHQKRKHYNVKIATNKPMTEAAKDIRKDRVTPRTLHVA